ncbi:MAG: acetyl-CoA carboxylase biotin carboxylase subunit [Chitinophagales bacterium]|jgi:acetyl-CoA carboxylase biotin carboxylase subunit|nr:acetyl-CoA carboxylase biotin carboxylase subunit [Chitinophagales bacterium]
MFKKILIANRGEIALRVIRTAREMGIKTVAVYSSADKDSLHVRFADEALCIGAPESKNSYLNIPNLMSALEITGADAVHPGYGFLSENAKFADLINNYGVKFIGPTSEQIRKMGDKITAKETMIAAGVPVIPGSEGLVENITHGKEIAKSIGFPIIIKATAGGGGKGMRIVREESEFDKNFETATQEALAAFGNGGCYIEKFIEEPRHIEIQVAGDQFGNVTHLSERDCSIQRRHQKLVEECPSPFVDAELRAKMGEAAKKAAKYIGYEGMGTIEFLVDKYKNFYFMEMNTRIQVEHTVTEEVMDFDLIKEQILIAAGEKISRSEYFPPERGVHAIECRINAENVFKDFAPSPGRITDFHTPKGFGVRVDTLAYAGYTVKPYYDSMIAKLICRAHSRAEAIAKMQRALDEFVVEGIHTTIPFHKALMRNEDFQKGNFDTGFLGNWDYIEEMNKDL